MYALMYALMWWWAFLPELFLPDLFLPDLALPDLALPELFLPELFLLVVVGPEDFPIRRFPS